MAELARPANQAQLKHKRLDELQKLNEQKFGAHNHKDAVHG
jgi:hypothetical protein